MENKNEKELIALAVFVKYLMISAISALCGLAGCWIHGKTEIFWQTTLICFVIISVYNIGSVKNNLQDKEK